MQKQLKSGVKLNINRTDRWQTNVITCHFIGPATNVSQTALTLLTRVLGHGCQAYPQNDQLNLALAQLYGANLQVEHQLLGNWHDLYFEISYVDPDGHGAIGQQALQLLKQLIFEPLFKVAHFGVQAFEIEYQSLKNELTDLQNDHDFQAFALTKAAFFEQSYAQQPTIGSLEELAVLDYQQLADLYQQLCATWRVEIVASGQFLPNETVLSDWPFVQRAIQLPDVAVSKQVVPVQEITREVVGQQTHLVLAYQIPNLAHGANHQRDVLRVLTAYLGGDEQSLLFRQVREKLGLAYDISTHEDLLLGWLVVEAGVDVQQTAAAITAIKAVINTAVDQIDQVLLTTEVNNLLNQQLRSMDNIRFLQSRVFRDVIFQEWARDFEQITASMTQVTAPEVQQMAAQLQLRVLTVVRNRQAVQ
ncbi:M16 family metallopeptidase [Lapidilactobacillus bayanensis]|uniref:M16 family metallopeptidase n=1 Tax=Lapidilactobacillus bayanensis TaxID=2485998 RepID=UPI000F77D35C|nr:insulinase family protein [Lapidilactobacillus bayanensis]